MQVKLNFQHYVPAQNAFVIYISYASFLVDMMSLN